MASYRKRQNNFHDDLSSDSGPGLAHADVHDADPAFDSEAFCRGESIAPLISQMLTALGEDPSREGLLKTPTRVDAAMKYLTRGYTQSLDELVNDALFESDNSDIVLVRDIEIFSMCEHHLLPFWGKVHIAYIPDGKVIGLSKLPRIADMFARRLQLQERLTGQVADAVVETLKPLGAAVIVECQHMCMMMRGVEKNGSLTVTRALRGAFKTDESLRRELGDMLRTDRG